LLWQGTTGVWLAGNGNGVSIRKGTTSNQII
jgi:hypothetical protein